MSDETFATIGQTTAVVAHELRNPLGTIRNSLFVLKHLELGGEAEQHLLRCERSVQRCDKIIQELLDYTRTNADKEEKYDLTEIVQDTIRGFRFPKGIEVRSSLSDVPIQLGVPSKIERSLINIIQNAVDAIQGKPGETDGKIFIRTTIRGDYIWIIVANDGPQIKDQDIVKIFKPLFSTKGFGVGLGLPVAKKIFEDHGGDLNARNIKEGVAFIGRIKFGETIDE